MLTDSNWSEKLNPEGTSIWLVTFYAPWDQNARELSPKLEEAASQLLNHGYKISFGAVDVSQNKRIGRQYGIDASPTVKILFSQDGEWVATDYSGEGEMESLKDFCASFYKEKNIAYSDLPEDFVDGHLI